MATQKKDLTLEQQQRAAELVNQYVPQEEAERLAAAEVPGEVQDAPKASKSARYVVQHDAVGPHRKGAVITADDVDDMQRLLDLGAVIPEKDADKDAK